MCHLGTWSCLCYRVAQLSKFNLNEIKCDIFAEQVSKLAKLIVSREKVMKTENKTKEKEVASGGENSAKSTHMSNLLLIIERTCK